VLGEAGSEEVVIVDATGKGVRLRVDRTGNARGLRGPVALKLTSSKPAVTSLASPEPGELLAADGNAIVRLREAGTGFSEVGRFTQWGAGQAAKFGAETYLDFDGDLLWVSDTANNRVLVFKIEQKGLVHVAAFSGDADSGPLDQPQRISARAGRAIVLDWGNQRLVKLEMGEAAR
jgi:hypothetical protein